MIVVRLSEMPDEQRQALARAKRLEWWSIAYLVSAIGLMALVMGSSQAMRTAWADDVLSLIPPVAFLIAARIAFWPATPRFPYGYHAVVSIAFLAGSLALLAMGLFLLGDAVLKLAEREHPTIGGVMIFGHVVWLGWLMIPALLWSGVPAVLLGRAKLPLATKLHDKVLYADASMNRADWMTAGAAIAGVVGIALGWWWADSAAAALISLDIVRDGASSSWAAIRDLMNEQPMQVGNAEPDPLPDRLARRLEELPWVEAAEVRLHDDGHLFIGEAFVVPRDESRPRQRLAEARRHAMALDWRLHDLTVTLADRDPESADAPASIRR